MPGSIVDGAERGDGPALPVLDKYHLTELDPIRVAGGGDVADALSAAARYAEAPLSPPERSAALHRAADLLDARRADLRETMIAEAGFPGRDCDGEISRALNTLRLSAEEATRITGEMVPFDAAVAGRIGFTMRVPVGTVVAITPFNAPLNTPAHKVGPGLAAGNAVILKPSEKTPGAANLLVRALLEAGFPPGAVQTLQGGADVARLLLDDPRPAFFAFTGSTAVGRAIQQAAGLRRTQMELGSIASTIVLDGDPAEIAAKCAGASFRKAGQVCTSIQTLYVADSAMEAFRDAYVAEAEALVAGDPSDRGTDVGPLISEDAAARVEGMLRGATILTGGTRAGPLMQPTVISDPASAFLEAEAFGPVAALIPVTGLDDAIARVNATPYGLATGIFTQDIGAAFTAARGLHVGGVHINETSSSRVDLMPYGGVKLSGFGQEGPRYAIREMTHERLVTFSGLA
ncbi:aldehyde dehydrogenase family protein [Jannaschia aquimarina]|uniref:SafD protein n=1 Tax=Jannaschia aquimarina TaxID=935700 RepID=A0A0D1D8L3_9RHOB|nr:aldehyde dehydrogenase family protein [Jannaschia aquimarina]KIT16253.1 Sulfoacetaldehyde dehydrogenase [Jannaschia aquimarina]SNT15223.1 succinate-semialdehyde dehydrogenase / glutarate-semialdehyde dehydrogenase [Jannaschia aquimarina]